MKDNLDSLLSKNKNYKVLNSYQNQPIKSNLKIENRIADLNPKIQNFKKY